MAHSKEQNKLTETIPDGAQTSDILGKDCKNNCLKYIQRGKGKHGQRDKVGLYIFIKG